MAILRLVKQDIDYLECNHPQLIYSQKKNMIVGTLSFDLKYKFVDESIADKYKILIDLNRVSDLGIPFVRETGGRILQIAERKGIHWGHLHMNNSDGEMCMIIPPKVKERYPKGFDLRILLEHIEEHLYWISYYEKYNEKPWKEYSHGDLGYLELYLENRNKYSNAIKEHFQSPSRPAFRRKMRELRKTYNI